MPKKTQDEELPGVAANGKQTDFGSMAGERKKCVASNKKKEATTTTSRREMRTAAPLFVPATSNGVLASKLRDEEEKLSEIVGGKLKVVERGGKMLRDLLTRANIFDKEKCGRQNCVSCSMGANPQNCRRRGIMYETYCTKCMEGETHLAKYVGECQGEIWRALGGCSQEKTRLPYI